MTATKPMKNMRLPNKPKKCMGLTPNFEKNQSVNKVKITVYKTVEPKFCLPILAGTMVYYLLTDAGIAGILGQIRYVAVHVAIHFYRL